jgi:hypothetical protein
MTVRLIYSRPLLFSIADDEPRHVSQPSLLGRLGRLLLEALRRSRTKSAARELRRYQHLLHKDGDADDDA